MYMPLAALGQLKADMRINNCAHQEWRLFIPNGNCFAITTPPVVILLCSLVGAVEGMNPLCLRKCVSLDDTRQLSTSHIL